MKNKHKPQVLYHGSSHKIINGFITRHRGRNQDSNNEGNQFGIYATPDYNTALVYSIGVKRTTFFRPKVCHINYSHDCIKADFQNCCWNHKLGFIYTISSTSFVYHNDFEYFSPNDVKILEIHTVTQEEINNMINTGKLILTEDHLPKSKISRFFLEIIDSSIRVFSIFINYIYSLK